MIAIESEPYRSKVIKKGSEDYAKKIMTKEKRFEELPLFQKSDLVVANFSLPYLQ